MTTKLKVEQPDSIEMTLTITAPLHEWKALQKQLADQWPSWKLGGAISGMITKADQHFTAQADAG